MVCPMDWKQLLASITRSVDEGLRLRNAYLVTENRILRQQMTGRVPLSDGDRLALAEIGQKLGWKARESSTIFLQMSLSRFLSGMMRFLSPHNTATGGTTHGRCTGAALGRLVI